MRSHISILCLVFVIGLAYNSAKAYSCSNKIETYINSESTVFIGKAVTARPIRKPVPGSIASFEVYYYWQGMRSSRQDLTPVVDIMIGTAPIPLSKGNDRYPSLKIIKDEFYLIIADAPGENSQYPTISSYCNGSNLLSHLYLTQDLQDIERHLGMPILTFKEPKAPCIEQTAQASFNVAHDIFEGTLVEYDVAASNQVYDIIRHRFKLHQSWKEHDYKGKNYKDIYSYRSQNYCGMLLAEQGCGQTFEPGKRYIIYGNAISKEAAFVTSCSRIVSGDEAIKGELDMILLLTQPTRLRPN